MNVGADWDDQELLAEQINYYRAVACEYSDGQLDEPGGDEIVAAIEEFAPTGDVLELACGPGTWTPHLLRRADTVTAVDASPEMQALAMKRVAADLERVRFVLADLFTWRPDRRYDGVFMGFWISHVPWGRFADFWAGVEHSLRPGGRVLFVDDGYRTEQELVEGESSTTIERRLRDGTRHRAVKVPHTPEALERELAALGWNVEVHPTSGPFYWGIGGRSSD
jgi:demethylmenaquinone methyltransferase/2-methoxy-6-polyprenyl-1,4-benzoquinol methylase